MTKSDVLDWLARDRLVPVVRAPSEEEANRVVEALIEGGINIIEVTTTVPGMLDIIQALSRRYGNKLLIGAGTVLDPESACTCIEAGAKFIVSPGFDQRTVAICNRLGVVVAPGALTPTEILTAWHAGADIVKVFPCDALGGPSYLKSIKAPLPHVKVMPTGGVTLENLPTFLKAGAIAVGVGTSLVDLSLDHGALVARARAFVAASSR